jgi:L-asparaginase
VKNVLLITTGGTIASRDGTGGLRPQLSSDEILSHMPDLRRHYAIETQDLLSLDSSNIQAEEWQIIARAVFESLEKYDGVVITHGTDTMAYTASMLSYMLQNLKKPVVLTGSQAPVESLLTDARNNLYTAFCAVDAKTPGVTVAFNRRIINGTRAVKVRTTGFDAFESVNAFCLAELHSNGLRRLSDNGFKPNISAPTLLKDRVCKDAFLLKLIPGTKPEIFDMLLKLNYRGVVLEAFGLGGMQFARRKLMDGLRLLTSSGIPVVACSQCLYEPADFSVYEAGRMLLDCGVISGRDMTSEAAVTKLMWALGQTQSLDELRRMFDINYAGEVEFSSSQRGL